MKKPKSFTLPKAPVGEATKAAQAQFGSPGLFAHHPPAQPGGRPQPRMERPRGGKGPRNAGG